MEVLEFILGVAVGSGAMIAKNAFSAKDNTDQSLQINQMYDENEKLRNRNKEAERRIEDLMRELQRANARFKDKDNTADDLEDDLSDAKAKIKKLTQQNDGLLRKIQDYKLACESYETEIAQLKSRLP